MNNYVSPVGYIDLDNDCEYSLDIKTTRSRESVVPKDDLAFYFETYIVPKYGLGNINVSNVASFMKDLEMNWTKLDQGLKEKVLDIMVDGILVKDSSFKTALLNKLNPGPSVQNVPQQPVQNVVPQQKTPGSSKSSFGKSSSTLFSTNNIMIIISILVIIGIIYVLINKKKSIYGYPKMF